MSQKVLRREKPGCNNKPWSVGMRKSAVLLAAGAAFVFAGCSEGVTGPAFDAEGFDAVVLMEHGGEPDPCEGDGCVDQGEETVLQITRLSDGTDTYDLLFTAVGGFMPVADPDTGPFVFQVVQQDPSPKNITISVLGARTDGSGANENVCGIRGFFLDVTDGDAFSENIYRGAGGQQRFRRSQDGDCVEALERNFVWGIPDARDLVGKSYTITAVGKYDLGNKEEDASAEVREVQFELGMEIEFRTAAAPAVAAYLLREAGISPAYRVGRTPGNHIADVAHRMGPGTDFNGVSKTDALNYCLAVRDFLGSKSPSAAVGAVPCGLPE